MKCHSKSFRLVTIMPRVNASDRNHIIRAYEEGRDFIALADDLNINRRTAYRIVQIFQRENRRTCLPMNRGGRHKIISQEMLDCLVTYVQEKPTATLLEMRAKLLEQFPTLPAQLKGGIRMTRLQPRGSYLHCLSLFPMEPILMARLETRGASTPTGATLSTRF